MNLVAERLTGWKPQEALGQHIREVLHLIREGTRQTVEMPVECVLREKTVVDLANHSLLIARDGHEIPIENSGAPIRGLDGNVRG